jgi:hypothetical protein
MYADSLARNSTIGGQSGPPKKESVSRQKNFKKRFTTITVEKVQQRFGHLWKQVYCSIYLKLLKSHRNSETDSLAVGEVRYDYEDRNRLMALCLYLPDI